ncbi:MAG: diacylglycerol kinase family lipid kinase [Chloroflexota bacterium]|nr:diacylglycerol kinase family lipid kinase [Chloroflexota bacterium]
MVRHPLDGWVMVICNPVSGSGQGRLLLEKVERALSKAGVTYRSEITTGRRDATRLARSALLAGCSSLVAIGGDGTLFETINGSMPRAGETNIRSSEVAVGLVQAGRGSDFGRSAGIPSDVDAACERLVEGSTTLIDLGHVTYTTMRGEERQAYFANAAGMGFDAEATVRANAAPHLMGGTVPYLSSLFSTLVTYHNKRMEVSFEGGKARRGRANSIVVANGQFFGGGMKIAPDARLSDGLFDVVTLGNFSKMELVRNIPRVYTGSHIEHPLVSVTRAGYLTVRSPDRLLLQADGEVLGKSPATFRVVPQALRLIA